MKIEDIRTEGIIFQVSQEPLEPNWVEDGLMLGGKIVPPIKTKSDLEEFIMSFAPKVTDGPIKLYTGIGGVLKIRFRIYGRIKLPRKLKKKIYMSAKIRRRHLPEYYK